MGRHGGGVERAHAFALSGVEPNLSGFIEAALAKGASDQFVAALLKANGWSDKEVYAAFAQHYEQQTGHAVPARRQATESARDAFLYLLSFAMLAAWSLALGSLAFKLIELRIPDPVLGYEYSVELSASLEIACLLVAFPVYVFVNRIINRGIAAEPANRHSSVRKWLTYLSLVIAASVLAGDAIAVLAYFLQGEFTSRFLLKAAVVLAIAGGIFAYYLREVGTREPRRRPFLVAAASAVVFAIGLGFWITGAPAAQRSARADLERVRDLAHISNSIPHADKPAAPPTAEDLRTRVRDYARLQDPVTGELYEYIPGQGSAYQLCAVFDTDNMGAGGRRQTFWRHASGRHCFSLDSRRGPPEWP